MNIEMMEMDDSARFTKLEHTQWWREANTNLNKGSYPYTRCNVEFTSLLGFCSPGSSIVLLCLDRPGYVRKLVDPLYNLQGQQEYLSDDLSHLSTYEIDNPTIDRVTSALYGFVNERINGWIYVGYSFATNTSLCLALTHPKRKVSIGKKVDDMVLDLTRVWSPWLNPNDPKVFKWFSENMTDCLHLYGHKGLESFDSYRTSNDDITTRLFDLSLTHYVKNISLPFADNHSVFINLAPCFENGGQTNIDANFIEVVKRSMMEWKWH